MTYQEKLKAVDTSDYVETIIDLDSVYCQYNPQRISAYLDAVGCVDVNPLSISASPHFAYLKGKPAAYKRMHRMYGRDDAWIIRKMFKFAELEFDVTMRGLVEMPIVLSKPLEPNKYNSGYEIYEGHHRLAICYKLMIDPVVKLCNI